MAVENDSYCAEADVIALVQTDSDYDATTVPTEAQLLEFMARRASEVYSWMAAKVGAEAPGPASYATTIDTTVDAGKALDFLCKQANAHGAAADALEAAGLSAEPSRSERVSELLAGFYSMKDGIEALSEQYAENLGSSLAASNHYAEGRVSQASFTSSTEVGLEFDGDTEW